MTFFIRLSTDVRNQPRLLPNNVDLTLTLHPSSNEFRLMFGKDADTPTVDLSAILLYVRRVKLSPPMATAIAETLRLKPALYPVSRVVVKTYQIPAGHPEINRENLSVGALPRPSSLVLWTVTPTLELGRNHRLTFSKKGQHL